MSRKPGASILRDLRRVFFSRSTAQFLVNVKVGEKTADLAGSHRVNFERSNLAHNSHTALQHPGNRSKVWLVRAAVTRQRPLRKKYTWLDQSIPPTSAASESSARTSPPMSAGESVFSSTKITPP
jgi:hypothetical protein